MPPVDIAELERLARAATPGPWWFGKYYDRVTRTADGDGSDSIAHVYGGRGQNHNAAYIAAASPATILALVEEVRESNAELRDALIREKAMIDERDNAQTRALRAEAVVEEMRAALEEIAASPMSFVSPGRPDLGIPATRSASAIAQAALARAGSEK